MKIHPKRNEKEKLLVTLGNTDTVKSEGKMPASYSYVFCLSSPITKQMVKYYSENHLSNTLTIVFKGVLEYKDSLVGK